MTVTDSSLLLVHFNVPSEPYGFAFSVWVSPLVHGQRGFIQKDTLYCDLAGVRIASRNRRDDRLPGAMPLTSPVALFTVATEGLSLLQVKGAPSGVTLAVSWRVCPISISVTAGGSMDIPGVTAGFTVISQLALPISTVPLFR